MEVSVSNINEASKLAREIELRLLSKLRAQEELTSEDWDDLDTAFIYDTELFELLGGGRVSWLCVSKFMNENNETEYWMYTKYTSDYEPTEYEGPVERVYPKSSTITVWDSEP